MVDHPHTTFEEAIRKLGRYPEEAFIFVREGLSYAAQRVHGPESDAHRRLQKLLLRQNLDWHDLVDRYESGELPEKVRTLVDEIGGIGKLDRHISGRQLCWGLRDFALHNYGMMARTVLEAWGIRATIDFGRIVFAFIECGMMQKQPGDSLADFEEVFAFDDAFDDKAGLMPAEGSADGNGRS